MKKILSLSILTLVLINCKSTTSIKEPIPKEKYSFQVHESWMPSTGIRHLSYSPIELNPKEEEKIIPKVYFSTSSIMKKYSNTTLLNFVNKQIKTDSYAKDYNYKLKNEYSEYGIMHILESSYLTSRSGTVYTKKELSHYYKFNGTIYILSYSSPNNLYEKYLTEVMVMITSFKIDN